MFEKYNVSAMTEECSAGSGGEYETGFGWTNGVILDLLDKYGHKMTTAAASLQAQLPMYTVILLLLISFLFY
ncbi:unnamed protein product [Gongylonema pulchrum]|uniref:Trehalase n=1 Tax=Gongylonema pulchrum TaxID=637853 RepID=A0A183ERJ2_9BILA|nr:unnamed protein product [Gongylonema pulchrum]